MELFYAALFGFMAIAAAALELGKPREGSDSSLTRDFIRFSRCVPAEKAYFEKDAVPMASHLN